MKKLIVISTLILGLVLAFAAVPAFAQGPDGAAGLPGTQQGGSPLGRPGRLALLGKVSEPLGLSRSQILSQLFAGRTLAEVAGGKLDGLVDALLQPRLERLSTLVEQERLTEDQAEALEAYRRAELEDRLSKPLPFQKRLLQWDSQTGE